MVRIKGANGLRAIACLLVLWHHITQRLNPDQSPIWLQQIHYAGMRGEVGVSLFFVLSGALLSYPFWQNFLSGKPTPSITRYIRNRAVRIIPATWLNLLVVTVVASIFYDIPMNLLRLVQALTFTNSYHYSTFFPSELNGPLWSIGLEVSCYILLPFVLSAVIKTSNSFRVALLGMLSSAVLLLIINPILIKTFMTSEDGKGWNFGQTGGAKQWLPFWNIDSFFTQFLCGSIAALFIAKVTLNEPNKKYDLLAIVSLLTAFIFVLIRVTPGAPDSFTKQPYGAPIYSILMAVTLFGSACGTYLHKFLDNRLFNYLANISFGIYLWHYFILTIIEKSFAADFVYYGIRDEIRWAFLGFIDVVLATGIAAISWKFFEKPLLNKSHKFQNRDRP
jgi:peptidoglycan/LPS O-acetylase OafA/YrhL